MGTDRVFLTDERRQVLKGHYHGKDQTKRTHKSRIRSRSRTALDELIEVAESPAIDNSDVFDPEQIQTLITILLRGGGGFRPGDEAPYPEEVRDQYDQYDAVAWRPHEDYAHTLYAKTDGSLRSFHKQDDDRTPRPRDS